MDTNTAIKLRYMHFVEFHGPKRLANDFDIKESHVYRVIKRTGRYKSLPDLITDEQYQKFYMNKSMHGRKIYKY